MENNCIAIGFSENSASEEAVKEVSLQIKSVLKNTPIELLIIFFTPNYKPNRLKETISITLRPKTTFGLQSPFVLAEERILNQGIVVCCFSNLKMSCHHIETDNESLDAFESSLRKSAMNLQSKKDLSFFSIPPNIDPNKYLAPLTMAFGKRFKMFGAGFSKKYGIKNFHISNEKISENSGNVILGANLQVDHKKISGFYPIGKSFTITKILPERNVILEINNQPASDIYKHYFGDKFETFKKSALGAVYPIGIKKNSSYRIINVLDFLGEYALLCSGTLEENAQAQLMVATPHSLLDSVNLSVLNTEKNYYDLAIVINSLSRKRILKLEAYKEMLSLKSMLGGKTKIIGLYCDYHIFPDDKLEEFVIDNNHLCVILLKNKDA